MCEVKSTEGSIYAAEGTPLQSGAVVDRQNEGAPNPDSVFSIIIIVINNGVQCLGVRILTSRLLDPLSLSWGDLT